MAWRSGPRGPGPEDPDGAAVGRVQQGDARAFDELVVKYQDRLVNYVRALGAGHADAEDAAQEAFLRAFRGLGRFRRLSHFKTWLYQIATNVTRTAARRRAARPEAASGLLADAEAGASPPAGADDLEARIVARDRLDRALAALPEDLRQAVVLRDVEGWEYREIAAMVGVPIGTVESRIFRARRRLRDLLGPSDTRKATS